MHRLTKGESRIITVRGRTDKGGLVPVGDRGPVACTSSDAKVLAVEHLGGDRFKVSYVAPGAAKITNLLTLNGRSEPFREVLDFVCLPEGDVVSGVGSEVTAT